MRVPRGPAPWTQAPELPSPYDIIQMSRVQWLCYIQPGPCYNLTRWLETYRRSCIELIDMPCLSIFCAIVHGDLSTFHAHHVKGLPFKGLKKTLKWSMLCPSPKKVLNFVLPCESKNIIHIFGFSTPTHLNLCLKFHNLIVILFKTFNSSVL